jgi:hypothetical protein
MNEVEYPQRVTQLVSPGNAVDLDSVQAGDLLFTHGDAWINKAIRLGEWFAQPGWWFRSGRPPFTEFDHVAMFCGPPGSGEITEALGSGMEHNHVSKYDPRWYSVVRIDAVQHDRDQMAIFCHHEALEHRRYGFATIASIGLTIATHSSIIFMRNGTSICSGAAAAMLCRGDYVWDKSPSHMMPSDLMEFFSVPTPGR